MARSSYLPALFSLITVTSVKAVGDVVISEFLAANDSVIVPNAVAGRFDDWIELHNTTDTEIDLGGWHLTDDSLSPTAWTFPAGTTLSAGAHLIVFASGEEIPDAHANLHTNFKLSKSGDYLALIRPDLSAASEFNPGPAPYPAQTDDISYGFHPTTGDPVYFNNPTPGEANDPDGIARVEDVSATPGRGYYDAAQTISLSSETTGATLYYTTDGSPPVDPSGSPSASATEYTEPVNITQTTVLRVAATQSELSPSRTASHTYILLDIENAASDGTDPGGLNASLLNQIQPAGYGNLTSGDYNMNPAVSRSTETATGHDQSISQAMLEGMRDIPTISISLPEDDFVGPNGIYTNSESKGPEWERECSAEYLPTANDTVPQLQENCGLRVQGGASRRPDISPKHSFSFRFRSEYGSGRLRQQLFPDRDANEFNSIALRAGFNNSWVQRSSSQRNRGSMIRDQWMRESMFDMGHEDSGAGFHVHLFINGLYWGIHNLAERQDNSHYAEYHGGDGDILDARNGSKTVQGTITSWDAMRATVATKNWANIQQVIDIDTYIDYQLLQRFGANQDLALTRNWRASGGGPFTTPTEMRPWKIYSWDGERTLEGPTANTVPIDPFRIRGVLETMPEYRLRFSDRAKLHLTGDGALTPAACQARWAKYADLLDKAIIAESARWGDHRRAISYTRSTWLTEQSRLYSTYFPTRTQVVINNLRADGLLSGAGSPVISINGAPIETAQLNPGDNLTLTGDDGTIYYTLDGTDPVLTNGTIAPGALSANAEFSSETVFPFESSGWSYLNTGVAQSASDIVVGNAAYDASDWKHPDFIPTGWASGQGLLAGPTSSSVRAATANTIFSTGPLGAHLPTIYFRKTFTVTDANAIITLNFNIIRDDGIIIYLNGREIIRDNISAGVIEYADYTGISGQEDFPFTRNYNLSPGDLREGVNVFAIELHNSSSGNSDMGLDLALEIIRPSADALINLSESATLTARLLANGELSPPTVATITLEALASWENLAISEINYHPREASISEKANHPGLNLENRDDFEFIEITNTDDEEINLFGLHFRDGIEFQSGLSILAAGERAVIVKNPAAFAARYGSVPIIGSYSGNLNNDGETITLLAADSSVIDSLTYNDASPWPSRPDGAGSSLERLSFSTNAPENWLPSVAFHGSPGTMGLIEDSRVTINEVSSNSANDFIELVNTTSTPLSIGGWLLSDSKEVYRSFVIPEQTLAPGEYATFTVAEFNAPATVPIANYTGNSGASPTTVSSISHGLETGDQISIEGYGGFSDFNDSFEVTVIDQDTFRIDATFLDNASVKGQWQSGRAFGLSSRGDDLWLLETDAEGRPIAFVDHAEFDGAAPDATLGRAINTFSFGDLVTMISPTPGAPNSPPLLGPVYLSEVHYNPADTNHQFVEISNSSANTVELVNWKLRGGVDFNFTAAHHVPANGSIILVNFDPIDATLASNFRSAFGLTDDFPLIGPMIDGPLGDKRGTVRLEQSGPLPDAPQITIDEVKYWSDPPWPDTSNGDSLQRPGYLAYGNLPTSWTTALPTPGSAIGENYSDWAAANSIGGPLDDPDNDGLENLLEFALGTDPAVTTSLPVGNQEITFPRNAEASGVALVFETSPDLLHWSPTETIPGETSGAIQQNSFTRAGDLSRPFFWRLRAISTR